ncbi:MAG: CoA pyrophosphatase [Alphaproteobacteria bacterium]|nr:CoA pyrophosphatase [Alphaproteobacteria bacterium]
MHHDELADVRTALHRAPVRQDEPGLARSAVAALLTPGRRVWFIRRADRAGDPWSGHVGFPGGRAQASDADLLATAVRETSEEVGVDLSRAELLGQLDDIRTRPVRSMMVRPYVFRLDDVPVWRPNHEVAALHAISLDDLLGSRGRGTMRWPARVGMTLPRVDFDGVRLWGLTLMMVDDLLDRIDGRGLGLDRPAPAPLQVGAADGDDRP